MIQLVLMPGMDGTGELFKSFIAALPEDFKALTVTYPRARILSNEEYAETIQSTYDGTNSCIIVAESFSTPYAIEFAATNPENLKALVLCAGFATNPVSGWRTFALKCVLPLLFNIPISNFALQRWLVGKLASTELMQSVREATSSVQPKVMKDRVRKILSCDQNSNLSKIKIPILYLQAKQDRVIPNSCFEEIKRFQPNTILVQVDGPHLILQREPQRAVEIIQELLSSMTL